MNEKLQNIARGAGMFEFNKFAYFDIDKFTNDLISDVLDAIDGVDESKLEGGDFEDIVFLIAQELKDRYGVT